MLRTWRRDIPIARSMPSSRVRSWIESASVFAIPKSETITALIGAVLGVILGVVFAALISQPLEEDGFALSYPIGTLIGLMVLAAIAGVIAAIGPARRAAKLDVLEALAYE